jgi:hypothetical protein
VAHCCADLTRHVEFVCDMHPDRAGCPDYLIGYSPLFDEYGIWVHTGLDGAASSWNEIRHCPFCGTALPPSRRDQWFDELEARGLEPDAAPAELQQHGWWTRRVSD